MVRYLSVLNQGPLGQDLIFLICCIESFTLPLSRWRIVVEGRGGGDVFESHTNHRTVQWISVERSQAQAQTLQHR